MIQTTFGRFGTSVARPRNTPTNANNTRANSNPDRIVTIIELAEGERFELSLGLPLSLISSQVPSTTQPPFHTINGKIVCLNRSRGKLIRRWTKQGKTRENAQQTTSNLQCSSLRTIVYATYCVEQAFQPAGSGDFRVACGLRAGKPAEPAGADACATVRKLSASPSLPVPRTSRPRRRSGEFDRCRSAPRETMCGRPHRPRPCCADARGRATCRDVCLRV